MSQEQWTAVDRYLTDLFVPPDPALEAALAASAAAGLPPINVSPNQGKLLQLLARVQGARSILEIGTLAGRCPPAAACSRWRPTRSTPPSPAPTSRAPASPTSWSCASGRRRRRCR